MDLIDLIKRPESKTLEFKRDLSSPDGALKAIVAFAPDFRFWVSLPKRRRFSSSRIVRIWSMLRERHSGRPSQSFLRLTSTNRELRSVWKATGIVLADAWASLFDFANTESAVNG